MQPSVALIFVRLQGGWIVYIVVECVPESPANTNTILDRESSTVCQEGLNHMGIPLPYRWFRESKFPGWFGLPPSLGFAN